jgi:hypothetical protein
MDISELRCPGKPNPRHEHDKQHCHPNNPTPDFPQDLSETYGVK